MQDVADHDTPGVPSNGSRTQSGKKPDLRDMGAFLPNRVFNSATEA